jgi:hypothetical protein
MQKEGAALRLAATDISNYLACRHLTQLDRSVAEGWRAAPVFVKVLVASVGAAVSGGIPGYQLVPENRF